MRNEYTSTRLQLSPLSTDHASFIYELVNTEGWLKFIGDRNVTDANTATAYIQKILDNKNVTYWVVSLKDNNTPIGVITFIKRNYLDHHDIGFAFLPSQSGNGYAYEAAKTILDDVMNTHSTILATTIPDNIKSIQLLEKLGFSLQKPIEQDGETLLVYRT